MPAVQEYYPDCPETYVVSLARGGDRGAFEELVRRRQSAVRGLLRQCCGDVTLADDLAQQAFLKVWLRLRTLREAAAFGGWLKRLVINTWLEHLRKQDALRDTEELEDVSGDSGGASMGLDLAGALDALPPAMRLCVVLAYHEGMTHPEIVDLTGLPLGTIKSNITRGSARLRELLAAYGSEPGEMSS